MNGCLPTSAKEQQTFGSTAGPDFARIGHESWEIIADDLSKAGWNWGCVSAVDSNGRTIWIADAHRGDGSVSLCVQMRS